MAESTTKKSDKKWAPNPAYLKATHLVLWIHPGAPSLKEQIRQDAEAQKKMERLLKT